MTSIRLRFCTQMNPRWNCHHANKLQVKHHFQRGFHSPKHCSCKISDDEIGIGNYDVNISLKTCQQGEILKKLPKFYVASWRATLRYSGEAISGLHQAPSPHLFLHFHGRSHPAPLRICLASCWGQGFVCHAFFNHYEQRCFTDFSTSCHTHTVS